MREREGGLVARAKEGRPGGGMPPQREASGEKMKKTRCEGFHSSFPASGQERRGQTLSHANPRHAELFSRFSKRKERKEEREEDGEELEVPPVSARKLRRVGARRSDKREGRRARGEINLLVVVQTHRLLNSSKPNTGSTPSARSSRRRGARHGELERGFYFEERREREEEERARRPPTLSLAREAGFFRLWSPLCARAVSRRKEVPFPLSFDSIAKQTSHSRSDAKKPSLGPRSGLRIAL